MYIIVWWWWYLFCFSTALSSKISEVNHKDYCLFLYCTSLCTFFDWCLHAVLIKEPGSAFFLFFFTGFFQWRSLENNISGHSVSIVCKCQVKPCAKWWSKWSELRWVTSGKQIAAPRFLFQGIYIHCASLQRVSAKSVGAWQGPVGAECVILPSVCATLLTLSCTGWEREAAAIVPCLSSILVNGFIPLTFWRQKMSLLQLGMGWSVLHVCVCVLYVHMQMCSWYFVFKYNGPSAQAYTIHNTRKRSSPLCECVCVALFQ